MIAGRDGGALEAALTELEGPGHKGMRLDVSDAAAWSATMTRLDRGGALHGLVTAAGVLGPIGPLDAVPVDEFLATIATNLVGTALALHHAIPRLRATSGRAACTTIR